MHAWFVRNRWRLLLLVLLLLGEAAPAEGSIGAPGISAAPTFAPLFAQGRRRRPGTTNWLLDNIWYLVGGTVGVIVLAAVVLAATQKKPKKTDENAGSPDYIGRYRLLNLMMTGQTSQVWEASDPSSGLHFAIKVLLPEYAASKEHREFLFHEAEVGMALTHPNVIKIVSVSKDQKQPHFVMDFFPGGSLKMRVMHKENDYLKEKLPEIIKQAATALAFMNAQGWVHRDVKPDNILSNAAGEVRLIDFAIAQKISKSKGKGPIQGTRSYMAPEQIRNEALDGRADVYSFGATLYELVTGRPPFRAANPQDLLNKGLYEKPVTPRSHNPEVSEEFAELLLKMLEKKKEDRPANFHEVLIKLRKIRIFKIEQAKKSGAQQEGR